MAADKNIVFKVVVDSGGAITGLKSVTKGIKDIDLTSKNAKGSVDKLTASLSGMGKGVSVKNIKLTTKELGNLQRQVGGVAKSSGAAAATTLELGRVISDAPYGIRGMANNVSQVASQIAFMSRSVDEVTGKVVGFGGALKSIGRTMIGPLGILLAIQAVIAAVDYFWGSMKKAETSSDDYAQSIKELKGVLDSLYISQDGVNGKIEEYIKLVVARSKIDKEQKEISEELKEINEDVVTSEENYNKVKQQRLDLEERGIFSGEAYNRILSSETFYLDELNTRKEKRNKLIKTSLKLLDDLNKQEDNYKGAKEGSVKALRDSKSALEKEQKAVSDTSEKWDEYEAKILLVQKAIDLITGGKNKGGEEVKREPVLPVGMLSREEQSEALKAQLEFMMEYNNVEAENAEFIMSSAAGVEESITNNKLIHAAKRAEASKKYAELEIVIAQREFDAKMMLLDGIGASLQASSELAGQHTAVGKGLAVAGATIDTFAAISAQLKVASGTPGAAIPGYAIAQAVATGLFGLANIKKILEVQVPGGGGGGGRGGGSSSVPSGRTFDFNLAGSTGQNQLAQTIGGQVQQPIKAYVVSSDITNQQQFDNQVQGEVKIG